MEKNGLSATFFLCTAVGIGLCVSGGFFLKYHQSITEKHLNEKIALNDNSMMRKVWSKLPAPYEFHVYIFNVTNPDEILIGEKPIVKEFGPYVYDVWQEKVELEDDEEEDTLSYKMKKTYYFNAKKSNGLTEEDEYTLVHFMYLGTANAVLRHQPTILPLGSKSIDSLFNKPKSLFVNVSIKKFLWTGYEVDCVGVEEFFAKVVCNDLKEFWFKYRIEQIRKDYYSTSAYGTFNNTVTWAGRVTINRGIKNIADIGKFVEYNYVSNFSRWQDDKCDEFKGTDGTMFHPFLSKKDTLYAVDPIRGRSFNYQFDSEVQHNRLKCYRYTSNLGTNLYTNPDDKCYCISANNCARDGVFELWKAMSWALVASNPHFYLADPWYTNAVDGLNPDKEKHLSNIDVCPLTGTVIRANFRMQLNAPLTKQPKYRLLKNVAESNLPLGWSEEKFILPNDVVESIRTLKTFIILEKVLACVMIGSGFALIILGAILEFIVNRQKPQFETD